MTGASTLRATAQGVRQPAGAALEYILHKIGPIKNHRLQKKKIKSFAPQLLKIGGSHPSKENLNFLPEVVYNL
jgi:hypothetical protein